MVKKAISEHVETDGYPQDAHSLLTQTEKTGVKRSSYLMMVSIQFRDSGAVANSLHYPVCFLIFFLF